MLTIGQGSLTVPIGFSVAQQFDATVPAGQSTTLSITLDEILLGTYSGEISFSNNDANENPFNFTIGGVVVDQFGEPVAEQTIVIHNIGSAPLTDDPASRVLPPDLNLIAPFDETVLPGETTSFTIRRTHGSRRASRARCRLA